MIGIKKSNISKHQILLASEELEEALAKEVLKELCRDLPLGFKHKSEYLNNPEYEL